MVALEEGRWKKKRGERVYVSVRGGMLPQEQKVLTYEDDH